MAVPHNRHAPTSIRQPQPTGICRRCGFLYPLSQLLPQYEWRGPSLGLVITRICIRTCLDIPNEQLRTIVIGPDPVPPMDPSPTFYSQQNLGGVAGPLDDANVPLFDED